MQARVIIATALFLLVTSAAFLLWLENEYTASLTKHRNATVHVVETAFGILEYFHAEERAKRLTTEAAQNSALVAIRGLRYHTEDIAEYFWVQDLEPHMLAHPFAPELEGQDVSHITDANRTPIFSEAVRIVHSSQEGFIHYLWPKPNTAQPVAKISFVKGFAPWNWILGSGIYIDEIESEIWDKALLQGSELIGMLALLLTLIWLGLRYVRKGLNTAIGHFAVIAEGNFDQKIEITQRDELGQLLAALKAMQIKLSFDLTEANHRANSALRIQTALDHVSTNVMIANPQGEIIYLNNSAQAMMLNAEPDIRKERPQFAAQELLGSNIAKFHSHHEHQQQILETLQKTHRGAFTLGRRNFELIANPVINAQGIRLGTVVEWNDCTEIKQVQDEVKQMVNSAQAGDLSQRLNLTGKDGFLLSLTVSLNQLLETMEGAIADIVVALEKMTNGDFTTRITNNYDGAFAQIRENTNTTIQQLSILVGDIRNAAEAINSAAREIAIGNTDLSKRTEQQAASLEETSATMQELTSTVKQNAQNASQANQFAQGAREVAEKGGNLVGQVVRTMGSITESANKIAEIISVIDSIAFQTNILALNAAVKPPVPGNKDADSRLSPPKCGALPDAPQPLRKKLKPLLTPQPFRLKRAAV